MSSSVCWLFVIAGLMCAIVKNNISGYIMLLLMGVGEDCIVGILLQTLGLSIVTDIKMMLPGIDLTVTCSPVIVIFTNIILCCK
uniref:Uncharacterized protein n=1 Tax=Arundo donax TaxID=35708 RepID=A0A0A9CVB3_ARUDO